MKTLAILGGMCLAACGVADSAGALPDSGSPPGDAAGTHCSVQIQLAPTQPQVGVDAAIRATASLEGVTGTVAYTWEASLDGTATEVDQAAADSSAIDIPVTTAGVLHVRLTLPDHPECDPGTHDVTVLPTTFATQTYRLRVTPPAGANIPTSDQIIEVHGGVDTVFPVALPASVTLANGTVTANHVGVAAYMRMTPVAASASVVEAYASASGVLPALRVLGQMHTALVVPTDPGLAPRVVAWTPGGSSEFAVDAGTAVNGVVRDPAGAALVGATVALTLDGVPSSVGTTGATGAFTLHAVPVAGATVAITVTPPAASGLPRLVASSSAIDLTSAWTVAYAAGLATRDLSGVHVTRGGSPVASAQVAVVGSIASAGTITAGATTLPARGDVRIATTTSASGVLAGRAPAAALSLVVTRTPSDVALAAFDLTAAAPATVATAAPVAVTGKVTLAGATLGLVRVDATGTGPLAGIVVQTTTDALGHYTLPLAAGGAYDLRLYDPQNRASPRVDTLASAATTDVGVRALPASVHLIGTISGGASSLAGAAVQLLCSGCTGPGADVPIAEAAADPNGRFRLAVPDPGTHPAQ